MLLASLKHVIGNRKRWAVDYSDFFDRGVTLVSASVTTDADAESAYVDDVVTVRNRVYFYLNGGTEVNETFTVFVQSVNSRTEIRNDTVEFRVVAA